MSFVLSIVLLCWCAVVGWRSPAFALAALFLGWQFALKVAGVVFLDYCGPVYSSEVFTTVGGLGSSAPLMILFVFVPLLAISIAVSWFPRAAISLVPKEAYLGTGGLTFGDLLFALLTTFIVCLYADMLRLGVIPLFAGLERYEYEGGVFHRFLVNYVFLVAFVIGYAVARARLLTGTWDVRYAAITIALFMYLFLTGNRFGSFYVLVSFALMPLAAVFVAPKLGVAVAPPAKHTFIQRLIRSPLALGGLCGLGVTFVAVAMANSLLNVRLGDPGEALVQRLLVQPVHLYWLTWHRLQHGELQGLSSSLDFLFNDPFDPTRNTTIQFLMLLNLGARRALEIYSAQDYAGGYPEVLLELGGVGFGLLIATVMSVIVALLYRLCITSVCRGRFFTSVMSIYVAYGVIGVFLGGMLNFVATETYWLKVLALLVAYTMESHYERRGRALIPWVLLCRANVARI